MVNEDIYQIDYRPFSPEVDTLCIILRKGTARRPLNRLEDQVVAASMNLYVSTKDDLYTWASFKSMIENEYGYILDEAIANHPTDMAAAIGEWLEGYSSAHNGPILEINGWEWDGYPPAPIGEPLAGLVPIVE